MPPRVLLDCCIRKILTMDNLRKWGFILFLGVVCASTMARVWITCCYTVSLLKNYGPWFVWDAMGHALWCSGSFGQLAGAFRATSMFWGLADCSSLCDVVSLV